MRKDRLKELREQEKMTQTNLGKCLGVSGVAVGKWELGLSEPNNTTLVKLANIFGVSTDYLLGNEKQNINKEKDTKNIEFNEKDAKNIELLKKALRNSGLMKGKDDLTNEEFNTLMDFIKANEKFLFKDK